MFDFTTFHAELDEISKDADASELDPHFVSRVGRTTLLDLMGRSARLFHPTATLTLLTNQGSRLTPSSFVRHEYPVAVKTLMLDRMSAQLAYLEQHHFNKPIIFIDTDILLNDSLAPLLKDDFDVALTWREDSRKPINGGFIILNNQRPDKVRHFFAEILEMYRSRYSEQAGWAGDQFAIRDYLGMGLDEIRRSPTSDHNGARVRLLPCDKFNFSPGPDEQFLPARLVGKSVIHFKGVRKRLMGSYWDDHLAPLEGQGQEVKRQRFNFEHQRSPSWVDRAEKCVELLGQIACSDAPLAVADVGCGDRKLRDVACRKGLALRYSGYDLYPQSDGIEQFDIEREKVPKPADVVVLLGVIEYLADPGRALRNAADCASHLVLSHVVRDGGNYLPGQLAKLGWLNHFYKSEIETLLSNHGWTVRAVCNTANKKTWLWLAQRMPTQ
jgi:hypothetical protein